MTDGILLAETQGDPSLRAYTTLSSSMRRTSAVSILHLLGYQQLLPNRRKLKLLILTTINAQRFSEHFNNAPVVEISGRMYPVEFLPPWFPRFINAASRVDPARRNKGGAEDG